MKCIIVDDSNFVRQTLSSMILNEGHEITGKYQTGEAFLEDFENIDADIIFLDIILPNMSGLDVLREISGEYYNTKIVMLSGITQGNTVSAALRLGATDFVSKPISKDQLGDILEKFSMEFKIPSVEKLSAIGVGCMLITKFLSELSAHASANLRDEIDSQSRSILDFNQRSYPDMFIVDLEKIVIELNPELWGIHLEDDVFSKLNSIPEDLKMELQFLYPDDFVNTLFEQAILTMASRNKIMQLLIAVPPEKIGLPSIPDLQDLSLTGSIRAGNTFEELEKSMAITIYFAGLMGPEVPIQINEDLIDENDAMKNSIFYSTIIQDNENYQEGLFGPLPVSARNDHDLSALIYTLKMKGYESQMEHIIFINIYFKPSAEKIVSDYNKLSFIVKARLSLLNYYEELDRGIIRSLYNDMINFILEQ